MRVTADRMVLLTVVNRWFHLREPTFVGAGQSYWIEAGELCVDRGGGRVSRHCGDMCR
ncbi:hypothetical protein [Actinoplanes sandaracinus]|uniref:hypothetical protein n=1 Tax=Actinoplanes sandaracinus TaxID=3045177 RepID=UPI0024A8DA3F|nr:hypothetical protein [Actinoplanes sandaracinus]